MYKLAFQLKLSSSVFACENPPPAVPNADIDMELVWDGVNPVMLGESAQYRCKQDGRYVDDYSLSTFEVVCDAATATYLTPAEADWPLCQRSKEFEV